MRSKVLAAVSAAGLLLSTSLTYADVNCVISEFEVEAYDHGGAYIHGKLNGAWVSWLVLCGHNGAQVDCEARATDRRMAIALAAQASGKNLIAFFRNVNVCSAVIPYSTVAGLKVAN